MRPRPLVVLFLLCLAGCASHTALSPEDRNILQARYASTPKTTYLRLSYFVTPFFGDATKKLLTPVRPEEVRLLEEPNGSPVSPGRAEKVVPAGTRVHIARVEFPTSWAVAERVIYTPRTQPWIYLEIDGEPKSHPFILVLRPQIKTPDEFHAEIERYLTERSPEARLAEWPSPVREAVKSKSAVVDMPAEALEMAWGYPERKQIEFEESVRKETWIYPGEKRVAHLRDGRLERFEGG